MRSGEPISEKQTQTMRAITHLMQRLPDEVEHNIFRLKPKFKTLKAGHPWVWHVVLSLSALMLFLEALTHLAKFDTKLEAKALVIAPCKARTGP